MQRCVEKLFGPLFKNWAIISQTIFVTLLASVRVFGVFVCQNLGKGKREEAAALSLFLSLSLSLSSSI